MTDTILHTPKNISFSREIVNNLPSAIKKQLPKEIAVIAVSPQESLKLNRQYRNKRKPANVLSFLYGQEYGEIIVCPSVIYNDAKKQNNTQVFQMTWMIVHGMLHLAGLHHEDSRIVAEEGERIENAILDILFNTSKEIRD
ncbi:MAG: rRNA maturation RNase YbeY [Patescibacteria group bacterium]